MIARRSVWSDPRVQSFLVRFVAAADEVHRLQNGKDTECRHFQRVAEQGHYAGRTYPTDTRQGIYACAPSGVLLASINSNDPEKVAGMLQAALAKWQALPPGDRLLAAKPSADGSRNRWLERYPADGLVLRVNSRDLPRDKVTEDWRARAWNQDFAWFTRNEARQFLPSTTAPGSRQTLPDPLTHRIARCHLLDNVRGQTTEFPEESIQQAGLTSEILRNDGGLISLRLRGSAHLVQKGTWPVGGFEDMHHPSAQERGFDAKLLGMATYDLKQECFTVFELVALGSRWGGTQYNGRQDDLAPMPMGVAFTLAGDTPSQRVVPAAIWSYGW